MVFEGSEIPIKKLGELCSFTQGVQIPDSDTIKVPASGYIRYIYIRDLFSDKFPVYVKDQYPNKVLSDSDIVMVNTGNTSGNVYRAKKGVLCNNAFKIAVKESARDILAHDYLWAYLNSDARERMLKRLFNPAGQPHVGHKNVARLGIPIPPISEQKKIAQILSTWDQAINATERLLENSQQRKKALMQQLLTGKKRLPGFGVEWTPTRLGDLFSERSEIDYSDLPLLSITSTRFCLKSHDCYAAPVHRTGGWHGRPLRAFRSALAYDRGHRFSPADHGATAQG